MSSAVAASFIKASDEKKAAYAAFFDGVQLWMGSGANLIHQVLEVINVFKAAIYAGKADIGHFV